MRLAGALKKYLEDPPKGMKVQTAEMMTFYKSLTDEEKVAAKAELRSYGMAIED